MARSYQNPSGTYKEVVHGKRRYRWQASVNPKQQGHGYRWNAWVVDESNKIVKLRHFKTRASARRCAMRWYEAHKKRNRDQQRRRAEGYIAPSVRCNGCEKAYRIEGDYLCKSCRHGL